MFVKSTDGQIDQYPYTVGNLRRDNPRTSFPKHLSEEAMESFGVFRVAHEPDPNYNEETHCIVESSAPVFKDGGWTLTKTVVPLSDDQIESRNAARAKHNRDKRNQLLSDTDWMALSDVTMSAEMTAYRQALRDITSHANWPHLDEADWPTKP